MNKKMAQRMEGCELSDNPTGEPLPEEVRTKMEAEFGTDFSAVRIHITPDVAVLGARACTRDSDIFFAPGQYAPRTARGQWLLAHELAHVVQQRDGRVQASSGAGLAWVDDAELEAEADRMADRVVGYPLAAKRPLRGSPLPYLLTAFSAGGREGAVQPCMAYTELDHEARITSLAQAYGEPVTALNIPVDSKVKISSSDQLLTVWGHGGQERFATLTEQAFVKTILAWKEKVQPRLTTVEIITCDAQHAQDGLLNSFGKRVANILKKAGANITVKALPLGQSNTSVSILWANARTNTFLYITAPDDTVLGQANTLVQGDTTGDLAQLGNTMSKNTSRRYTLNFGALKNLRSSLVTVK